MVAMNASRYEKLVPDLKKVIDATTGLTLSLKGADTYDKKNDEAIAAAKKSREIIMLSADERKRWAAAFKPMIEREVQTAEKAGLPARGLVTAYGLLS
jgi:TRAP-type C4-dicarboxylate transport system substrate-binding protein